MIKKELVVFKINIILLSVIMLMKYKRTVNGYWVGNKLEGALCHSRYALLVSLRQHFVFEFLCVSDYLE